MPRIGERIFDSTGNVLIVKKLSAYRKSNYIYANCEPTGEDWFDWFDVDEQFADELANADYCVTEYNLLRN